MTVKEMFGSMPSQVAERLNACQLVVLCDGMEIVDETKY